MEIVLLVAVAVAIGAFMYYNRNVKSLDVNNDGKIDANDAKAAIQNVVEGATASADVNNDGKVDAADVAVVKEKAKAGAKKAATKAKETVKKATTRGRKAKE